MRRGDIRTAVLAVLADEDAHGYQVIQTLEARTDGAWRPSPGSIYPLLQLLADSGLATVTEDDGKRVFSITEAGRAELAERVGDAGGLPWERAGEEGGGLRSAVLQLQAAARQIGAEGDPAQVERAVAIVTQARKGLYGILAE
jgi:DNA-binding PadR family transcriptional regulator